MSTPQNTIAIVYDYHQTLSPSYLQDEVVFPTFGMVHEIASRMIEQRRRKSRPAPCMRHGSNL